MLKTFTITRVETIVEDGRNECGHVVIPEGVTIIGDHAFMHSKIESIELPKTVRKIGYCSFSDCKSLKRVEIPYGVRRIAYGAFSGCTNLEYISIPETVASIKGDLFSHCSGLKKIVVPLHLVNQAAEATSATIEILR